MPTIEECGNVRTRNLNTWENYKPIKRAHLPSVRY